jgi:hypothetical protein
MQKVTRIALLAGTVMFLTPVAQAQVFTANLSGPAESPPNASPGTGFGTVTLNTVLNTMRVQVSFSGLTGTTTASHIHSPVLVPGGNAGVATQTPTFIGFPLGVTSGVYDQTFDLTASATYNPAFVTANGGTVTGARNALVSGISAGQAYLNIHTTTFGGGEIRGFLTAVAPEPGSMALIGGLGLIGLPGLVARRRRAVSRVSVRPLSERV